jgi:hypothetical protein
VQDVLLLVAGAPDALTICHNLQMCGRYRLSRRKQLVEEYFDSVSGKDDWNPRYNVAPTQLVPIIRQNPKEPRRELSLARWVGASIGLPGPGSGRSLPICNLSSHMFCDVVPNRSTA